MIINPLYLIIAIIVLISLKGINDKGFMHRWSFIPYEVKHHRSYYRFISHIFVHADIPHLIFNMISLYYMGQALVFDFYLSPTPGDISYGLVSTYGVVPGWFHFFVLLIFGGVVATFWPMIRNQDNPSYLSVGASGGVSAVVFAMILWNPSIEMGLIFLPIYIPAYLFGPVYLLIEFFAFRYGKTNIAHDAHIGGAIFGILYILVINFDKARELISAIAN